MNPSRDFDTLWYLEEYPSVKDANVNPFVHYIVRGKEEGRFPKPYSFDVKYKSDYFSILNSGLFDFDWFCDFYSLSDDVDPIIYYLEFGVELGSRDFDTLWYLEEYPSVKDANVNPFVHYIVRGKNEGKLPRMFHISELNSLNLKKTIKGKNNYYFLINDSNNELKQHFDKNYSNLFNKNEFLEEYYIKKEFFEQKNKIKYFYFVVPDKSLVCKNFIPFYFDIVKRNVEDLDIIPNFVNSLDESCYWKNDTHLNLKGAKILSFKFLNHIDSLFDLTSFESLINASDIFTKEDPSDLLTFKNWSYSLKDKDMIKSLSCSYVVPKLISYLDIPDEFKYSKIRESEHIFNPESFSDLKVLIFRDSSATNLKYYLSLYFREIFLYWDHMDLSEEVINWYNPDVILEIRIERFLEHFRSPDWIKKLSSNYK